MYTSMPKIVPEIHGMYKIYECCCSEYNLTGWIDVMTVSCSVAW